MEITEIKQKLTIQRVLQEYGLQPDKNNLLKCCFHDDKTASLQIYPNTNTYHCFSCGKSGDTIQFIQDKEKITKHEAILKAKNLVQFENVEIKKCENVEIRKLENEKKLITQEVRINLLTKLFESFKVGIRNNAAKKPRAYTEQRNLDINKLEIGYNVGQFHLRGRMSEQEIKQSVELGLLTPYNQSKTNAQGESFNVFAKECIIFPLKNKENQIVSFYGRSILSSDKACLVATAKHFYLKDRQGLYPNYPKQETEILILTEAIIDAATLLCTDVACNVSTTSILSLYGTNGLTQEHRNAISELEQLKEIILFFDGDEPGRKAIEQNAKLIREIKNVIARNEANQVKITYVETPENEDINSLSVGHEPEIFNHLIEKRKSFFSTEKKIDKIETTEIQEIEKEKNPLKSVLSASQFNTANPDFIIFTTNELQFTLLGGINLQQLDRMRVTLKISSGKENIRHNLDLYNDEQVSKLIEKAAEKLETSNHQLTKAIEELTEKLENYRLSKIESRKEKKNAKRELTEERRQKAINFLKSKDLLQQTNDYIGKTGIVGEENNRLLIYLIFTSRLREQPLHIISLGSSGTGKTYLQEKISELIPENDKLEITILSENAFYYFEQKELRNKLVLIEDMDGAENVLYPLLSSRKNE